MKTIKMTASDKEKGCLAGLVYELSDKEADRYLNSDMAIEITRNPKPDQKGKKGK